MRNPWEQRRRCFEAKEVKEVSLHERAAQSQTPCLAVA